MSFAPNEIRRGDIFWIYNSYTPNPREGIQAKNRPAIIVSNDANNRTANQVEVVFLTTAKRKILPTHCIIQSESRESTALCEQIQTISKDQIGDFVRRCSHDEMEEIEDRMMISLGIDGLVKEDRRWPANFVPKQDLKEAKETIEQLKSEIQRLETREEFLQEMYEKAIQRQTRGALLPRERSRA